MRAMTTTSTAMGAASTSTTAMTTDHAHDLRGASRRNLIIALTLISTYMLAEVVGGILSGSLALIADAGHMLTDALAIGMALAAMWMAERSATAERTFGYERTEVLAAMLNTIALWLIARVDILRGIPSGFHGRGPC
ncbi:Cadmium, cobalt and zinc/H(+)-K(+) antiporter [Geodia barretti]|uniref:Cadmium, cobalt and zinc/H(+)-K(+) antiporter n=1 Tax=Geodia barretti TaxID=519541 RepID=A0AA35W7R9_GEOBA|nr:Cadmium, cobalt and zinc/H(+)-K(+) antiporter [Geodia barretti]